MATGTIAAISAVGTAAAGAAAVGSAVTGAVNSIQTQFENAETILKTPSF